MKKQCKSAGAGSVMKASENVWHVIAGERAPAIAAAIKLRLERGFQDSESRRLTEPVATVHAQQALRVGVAGRPRGRASL